jgi:hypothetical protein
MLVIMPAFLARLSKNREVGWMFRDQIDQRPLLNLIMDAVLAELSEDDSFDSRTIERLTELAREAGLSSAARIGAALQLSFEEAL